MTPQGTLVIKLENEAANPVIVNSSSSADLASSSTNNGTSTNNLDDNTD